VLKKFTLLSFYIVRNYAVTMRKRNYMPGPSILNGLQEMDPQVFQKSRGDLKIIAAREVP